MSRPVSSIALWAALLLAACAPAADQDSNLSVTVVGEGDTDHGLSARLAAELRAATLISRDSGGNLVGGLASSWRFVDQGRILILRLRPVKWSDDRPLVADEVVASFRRAARPPAPHRGFRLAGVEGAAANAAGRSTPRLGVLAPTSRVVEIRLEAPAPQLLDWLAEPGLSVRRLDLPTLSRYQTVKVDEKDAATGAPLRLARLSEAPEPDTRPAEVTIAATRDAAGAVAEFRRGAVDVVVGEGLAGLLEARVQGRSNELRLDRLHGVYGWRINTRQGALADPALRRLLAERIDRAALVRSFGLAGIQPEAGLLPDSLRAASPPPELAAAATLPPGSVETAEAGGSGSAPLVAAPETPPAALAPEVAPPPPDAPAPLLSPRAIVARAMATSAPAALDAPPETTSQPQPPSDSPLLTLRLLVPPGREHAQVAQRVAADWRSFGVQLVLVEADAATRARLIAEGDFDLAVDDTSLPVPDAAALLDRFRCGQGAYCNDAADALLAAARMVTADQRPGQLAIVERVLREDPPFIGLFGAVRWALVSPRLEGWTSNQSGVHPLGRIGRAGR